LLGVYTNEGLNGTETLNVYNVYYIAYSTLARRPCPANPALKAKTATSLNFDFSIYNNKTKHFAFCKSVSMKAININSRERGTIHKSGGSYG